MAKTAEEVTAIAGQLSGSVIGRHQTARSSVAPSATPWITSVWCKMTVYPRARAALIASAQNETESTKTGRTATLFSLAPSGWTRSVNITIIVPVMNATNVPSSSRKKITST